MSFDDAQEKIAALIDSAFIDSEANRELYLFYLDMVEHVGRRVPSFGSLSTMLTKIISGLIAEVIETGAGEGVFESVTLEWPLATCAPSSKARLSSGFRQRTGSRITRRGKTNAVRLC